MYEEQMTTKHYDSEPCNDGCVSEIETKEIIRELMRLSDSAKYLQDKSYALGDKISPILAEVEPCKEECNKVSPSNTDLGKKMRAITELLQETTDYIISLKERCEL